ncbi:hypothetical protein F5X68DRAFT_21004 [Plectosphaerella plurivora]|uniref:Uncharacterized protein n=1 Tax=Plectosphaerella plurivora TaxID=936078 RepID=A0A9P8VA56_9PEZI|nr:hypothetical protein F5X68DRAFT_21004 [Plectosphaerella plurivora]
MTDKQEHTSYLPAISLDSCLRHRTLPTTPRTSTSPKRLDTVTEHTHPSRFGLPPHLQSLPIPRPRDPLPAQISRATSHLGGYCLSSGGADRASASPDITDALGPKSHASRRKTRDPYYHPGQPSSPDPRLASSHRSRHYFAFYRFLLSPVYPCFLEIPETLASLFPLHVAGRRTASRPRLPPRLSLAAGHLLGRTNESWVPPATQPVSSLVVPFPIALAREVAS